MEVFWEESGARIGLKALRFGQGYAWIVERLLVESQRRIRGHGAILFLRLRPRRRTDIPHL